MKREIRNAISQGIKASELNGYKWTITANSLEWSYGEEFIFTETAMEDDEIFLTVKAVQAEITVASLIVGTAFYADTADLVDAYRIATEATIRNANRLY